MSLRLEAMKHLGSHCLDLHILINLQWVVLNGLLPVSGMLVLRLLFPLRLASSAVAAGNDDQCVDIFSVCPPAGVVPTR